MNQIKGTISLNPETGTVSIQLENGHHASHQFPRGIQSWLETELEVIEKQQRETVSPFTVYYRYQNGFGHERKIEFYAKNKEDATSQFRRKFGYDEIRIMRIEGEKR